MPITTSDEAEVIAKEYAAKKFGLQGVRILTTIFDTYKYFTVTVEREAQNHSELQPGVEEEPRHDTEADQPRFYDVKVDLNGLVVGFARTIRTSDEAEEIAKEHAAKSFGFQDFQTLITTFDGNYFTVTVWRKDKGHTKDPHSEVHTGVREEELAVLKASVADITNVPPVGLRDRFRAKRIMKQLEELIKDDEGTEPHSSGPQKVIYYDVKVDKNGLVVGVVRTIRSADEAEAIAKEYALRRYGLTHFRISTTTFDGNYFTIYAGALAYEGMKGGVIKTTYRLGKSKFYTVKVDKNGIVVGWTTESWLSRLNTQLQRLR